MQFFTYILFSEKLQRYYVGHTKDMANRLREHNAGETRSTRQGIPWRIIHTETFSSRSEAMFRELQIKKRGIRRYLADNMHQPG